MTGFLRVVYSRMSSVSQLVVTSPLINVNILCVWM